MAQPPGVHELTDAVLRRFYDPRSIQRGRLYAQQRRVEVLRSEPGLATGIVRGNRPEPYLVEVEWSSTPYGIEVLDSCACPVGDGCKHAVALVLTLRSTTATRPDGDWRRALSALHAGGDPAAKASTLAIEVALRTPKPTRYAPTPTTDVTLRPLRMGTKGNWIRTGISWRDVASRYEYALRDVDPEQRRALRAVVSGSNYDTYMVPAAISLAQCTQEVWGHLRDAVDLGVALVPERGTPGPVRIAEQPAAAVIDLTTGRDATTLTCTFTHDDLSIDTAAGWGTIGAPPHGLYGSEGDTLHLVPLERSLHPAVARLAATPSLVVPAHDLEELLDEYVPLLARHAGVASSDGSVTITTSEFDGLVALVERPSVDIATVRWAARYRRGDRVTTYLLDEPIRAGRDLGAERHALAILELPTHLLPQLAGSDGRPADIAVGGHDTVVLLGEVVPWLIEGGHHVEVLHRDVPELREATEDPLISLSVTDPDASAPARRDTVGNDWFDLAVEVSVDGEPIEFAQLFAALSREDDVLVLPSGTWLRLDRPELAKLRDLIAEARGLADDRTDDDAVRISRFQTSWWHDLTRLGVVQHQSQRWADGVARLSALTAPEPTAPPQGLTADLRPYQRDGLDWLAFLHRHGLGGILADDMGLGKTVQTLALMLHVLEQDADARFLVVAPTSVVENWHREAEQFAGGVEVRTIRETATRRGSSLVEEIGDARIVVTSYALFRIEFDDYQEIDWELLVLDEAQFVKNHQGKTYQCVRRLDVATKVAVTGTPLENSLMDLWSLLSITAPGLYPDPKRFSEVYRAPIESGRAPERLATLRRRIAPLMRRRTKDEVLAELPPKTELTVEVEMSAKHSRIYQTQLQRQRQKVLGLVDDVQRHRFEILKSLTLLRQLSLDPGLVEPSHDAVGSAKLDRLVDDLVQVIAEGHRALVFSQFTRYLARVRSRLDDAGIGYSYLDGRTRKRDTAIARFKDGDVPVFVISLKAGGFGLNLTEADYCFVLDPWWNPAVETQAVDRTHRIGQQRAVMVYRYVSVGTIEEKVMELKERKAALFSSVVDADGSLSGPLDADDIRSLFELTT
jgi:superfamily II DNA or RNA helicase